MSKLNKMANFNEKSRTAYNSIAAHYDSTHDGRFTQKFKDLLLMNVVLKENCRVLDVACGNGSLLAAFNRQTPIRGYGIDIAPMMIKYAAANNPGMEFHVAGCEEIPHPDNSMDIITVCSAYHHFPDVAAFAQEAIRILKPAGKLYIYDIYLPTILRILVNPFVPLSKHGDVRFYSPQEIIRNFTATGFEKAEMQIFKHILMVSLQKRK
jgi:ubiquinone/menaquinone biosynthesis C-methylase UbiE